MDVAIIVVPVICSLPVGADGTVQNQSQVFDQLAESGLVEQMKQSVMASLPSALQAVKSKSLTLISEDGKPVKNDSRLTPRENEVLFFLAKGLTQKEIARALEIAPSTVGGYKKEIYRKLEVSTAAEAAAEAVKSQMIGL